MRKNSFVKAYIFMSYENLIKVLHQKDLRLVLPENTNDPFEFRIKDLAELDSRKSMMKERTYLGFLSFSRSYKSAAMWGHYGDSHRGCCLEFIFPVFSINEKDGYKYYELDIDDKNNFFPSILEDNGEIKGRPVLWNVKYTSRRVENTFLLYSIEWKDEDYIYEIHPKYITKDFSWRFENEMRIMFNTKRSDVIRSDMFFISGLNRYISRIILGVRSNVSVRRLSNIVDFLRCEDSLYSVKVVETTYSKDKFEVEIVKS